MESLGQFMKRERMARGVTLEEISDNTRIKVQYLDALEREEFDILPAEAFVRGFIRAYCRYLGINQEEAIGIYNAMLGRERAKSLPELIGEGKPRFGKGGITKSLVAVVSLTAAMVLVGAIIILNQREGENELTTSKPDQETINGKAGALMKVDEEKLSKTLAAGGGAEETQGPLSTSRALQIFVPMHSEVQAGPKPRDFRNFYAAERGGPASAEDSLVLTISASGEAWVQLKTDDREQRAEALLKAGEKRSWSAKDKFVLTISDVSKTNITLNGQEVTIPANQTNVIKNYTLTRENLN